MLRVQYNVLLVNIKLFLAVIHNHWTKVILLYYETL